VNANPIVILSISEACLPAGRNLILNIWIKKRFLDKLGMTKRKESLPAGRLHFAQEDKKILYAQCAIIVLSAVSRALLAER